MGNLFTKSTKDYYDCGDDDTDTISNSNPNQSRDIPITSTSRQNQGQVVLQNQQVNYQNQLASWIVIAEKSTNAPEKFTQSVRNARVYLNRMVGILYSERTNIRTQALNDVLLKHFSYNLSAFLNYPETNRSRFTFNNQSKAQIKAALAAALYNILASAINARNYQPVISAILVFCRVVNHNEIGIDELMPQESSSNNNLTRSVIICLAQSYMHAIDMYRSNDISIRDCYQCCFVINLWSSIQLKHTNNNNFDTKAVYDDAQEGLLCGGFMTQGLSTIRSIRQSHMNRSRLQNTTTEQGSSDQEELNLRNFLLNNVPLKRFPQSTHDQLRVITKSKLVRGFIQAAFGLSNNTLTNESDDSNQNSDTTLRGFFMRALSRRRQDLTPDNHENENDTWSSDDENQLTMS